MAKKTNKTAHVLNLLSGSTGQKTAKNEPVPEEKEKEKEKISPVVSNVKMDSSGKEDAVSDIIHQQLLSEFMETESTPEVEIIPDIEPVPEPEPVLAIPEPEPLPEEEVAPIDDLATEAPIVETEKVSEPEVDETPVAEKEPEFIVLNIIEQIVRDKIIYFMRQFEVCTCDRCIADTVALTLNGLKPKYIVTSPAAAAPLISFYTNKYISDITVEATKACMVIKENPRHTKTDETS